MIHRLKTLLQLVIFWFLFFISGKLLFILFNYDKTENLNFISIIQSIGYGLKLDLSFIGYLLIFSILLLIIHAIGLHKWCKRIFTVYNFVIIIICSLFILTDAILYQHWSIKLDIEPFKYLNNPIFVLGNLSILSLIFHFLVFITFVISAISLYKYLVVFPKKEHRPNFKALLILLVIGGNLIWPIRGGLDIQPKIQLGIPIQVSTVFFHSDIFYNHAAYNIPWYMGQSLILEEKKNVSFHVFDDQLVNKKFKAIEALNHKKDSTQLLKTKKPNLVLIVLESFTANIIEPLGGKKGVAPNFNKLCKEGVLFTHCYSTGTHSDKGIGAILTGYPALPKTSVVQVPTKLPHLQYLPHLLKDKGYSTQMNYGGDMNFGNFNLLFNQAGFEKSIGKNDFPTEKIRSSWGVPDEHTLSFLYDEIENSKEPFLQGLFTLSSHPPFDIPAEPVFEINNEDDKFCNAVHYTDREIGKFVDKMKKSEKWDNTLIILIADHGVDYVNKKPRHHPAKFKIPMLWLGGALKQTGIEISQTCSQTDLPKTLLSQLNIDSFNNPFSKNILQSKGYAFYDYNNGIAFLTDSSATCLDLSANRFVINDSSADSLAASYYMQYLVNDFNQLDIIK